ncbi:MAG: SDR family NAD(P)-dependent oxidoreductase [Isosphaeraceae bacterium]
MNHQNNHVILSGGSRGLGRTLVAGLLEAGYQVSTFARSLGDLAEIAASDDRLFAAAADLCDSQSLADFLAAAQERFGVIRGLINGAGIAADQLLTTMREDTIESMIATNLLGTIRLTRMVVRRMLVHRQGGSIVNISSIVSQRGYRGLAVYSATKAGLDGLTRALARELGPAKIRVNSIAPGYLRTAMTSKLTDKQRAQILRRTPLGRLGTPEDIVGPVNFLLSDDAAFMTGQILVIDGGITT